LFEELRGRGYDGAHDSVHRFAKAWRNERARIPVHAFVPLSFAPGEAYQFDWGHETITLQGLPLTIKAAHMKLSHSRMPFVRAYFRETQELVFDAHDKAFLFYGGVCRRGIYDNMKTAVDVIFVGKARQYNRRFLQMCSHPLIEPVACTPASGWEKGQVENQVGNLRGLLFRPKPRVKSLAELNAWLEDQCIAYTRRTTHPEFKDRTICDVFQDERASLMECHEILEAMTELKLYGMRAKFDEIAGKGLNRRDEILPLLASLTRAERTHRQARSISYRMSGAKFPVLKDIGKFVFADTPVDEGLVRELATGSFLGARRNVIFIGGTGTGKTHLYISVAAAVVRPSPAIPHATRAEPLAVSPVRRGASSTWWISSISLNGRRPPAAAAASPRNCYAMIPSPLTNWVTCHSASQGASCCPT
jgi:transposase